MNLRDSKYKSKYIITNISAVGDHFSRFLNLGFHIGATVVLKRKAPIFGNPLLFEIGESLVALTKQEAQCIEVEVQNE